MAILATSREPLAIEGEVTWRVPSLGLPPAACETPEALGRYDAVKLFVERAVQADFCVTSENAPAVARICQQLDGIPLALELAAVRVRSLPTERISAALDDRFGLLAARRRGVVPRHETLRASVDWSHELLGPEERVLFRRLGIFAGGFGIDAADSVAAFDPVHDRAALDVLTRLVDKSLVHLDGLGRYRLLETVRQYALDRLADAGETEVLHERHLAWAGNLARTLESERLTPTRPRWMSWRLNTPTSVLRWSGRRLGDGTAGPWRSWGHWPSSGPSTGTTGKRRLGSHDWWRAPKRRAAKRWHALVGAAPTSVSTEATRSGL